MQSWFILLLALGCISTVSTYQCYDCASPGKDGCGDPFASNSMTDNEKREAGDQVCMKTKSSVGDVKGIVRGMAPVDACPAGANGCKDITLGDLKSTMCCCNSNLCNGASTVQLQSLVVYFIIGTLAISTYRWL